MNPHACLTNPLASTKCAIRLLMALAAITGILLLASCSSSTPPPPNQEGFGLGDVNGTYVFSSLGADSTTGDLLALAGAFVANGTGSIKGGTMDVMAPGLDVVDTNQTITSGSYSVSTDGRGQVTLTSAAGTFAFAFVLTSVSNGVSSHGLLSEFDGNGSGSGTLDLQTAVTSLSQLANPYAFTISGQTGTLSNTASAGAFTLNSSGTITAGTGIQDLNASGITYSAMAVTGGATLGSGTGPGSLTLTSSSFALTFDYYPIDATHFKLVETDGSEFLAGDAFIQTGASIPNGAMVFTMGGGITAPVAVGGLMNSDGTGNFSSGLEDVNDAGTLSPAQLSFSGTAAGPASTGGRVAVNLTGFIPATPSGPSLWAIYPSGGGLLLLEMDSANVTQGVGYAQTATSFSAACLECGGTPSSPVGYGLNLSGYNLQAPFEVDDIAQFDATTGTSNNMTGILEENDEGVNQVSATTLTGTYTPDSPATGRGSILVPSLKTPLGGLTLEYYVVDSSTVVFIEVDSLQVSAGIFEEQSSAQSGAALSHMALVHPAFRPHAALRRK